MPLTDARTNPLPIHLWSDTDIKNEALRRAYDSGYRMMERPQKGFTPIWEYILKLERRIAELEKEKTLCR